MVGASAPTIGSATSGAASSAAASSSGPAGFLGILNNIWPLLLIFGFIYVVFILPQRRRAKAQQQMMSNLAKGDEVVLTSGLMGTLEKVGDNFVEVAIADQVIVKAQKESIAQVLPKGSLKTVYA
ncbi:MAG: preprotein translocase subunit YajC [Gammaproteobacteria bacterium]|nr:preprotein translocase subunit YajC [Gammaproteobacteria bacterium]